MLQSSVLYKELVAVLNYEAENLIRMIMFLLNLCSVNEGMQKGELFRGIRIFYEKVQTFLLGNDWNTWEDSWTLKPVKQSNTNQRSALAELPSSS